MGSSGKGTRANFALDTDYKYEQFLQEQQNNASLESITIQIAKLNQFVENTLKQKYKQGNSVKVGDLPKEIVDDMIKRGEIIDNYNILLLDEHILKYRNHPKNKKESNLPYNEYEKIIQTINNPSHIYRDIGSHDKQRKYPTYAITSSYSQNNVIKVILRPNYKKKTIILSIGVVDSNKMNDPQYIKIK